MPNRYTNFTSLSRAQENQVQSCTKLELSDMMAFYRTTVLFQHEAFQGMDILLFAHLSQCTFRSSIFLSRVSSLLNKLKHQNSSFIFNVKFLINKIKVHIFFLSVSLPCFYVLKYIRFYILKYLFLLLHPSELSIQGVVFNVTISIVTYV